MARMSHILAAVAWSTAVTAAVLAWAFCLCWADGRAQTKGE